MSGYEQEKVVTNRRIICTNTDTIDTEMAELYEIISRFLHFCFWSDSDAPCIVELVGWLEQKIELDGLKYSRSPK